MFPAISRVLSSEHFSRRLWQWGLQVNIVHVTLRYVAQDFLVTNMLSCVSDRGGQLTYLIMFISSLTVIQRIISLKSESHEMNYIIILVLHTWRRHTLTYRLCILCEHILFFTSFLSRTLGSVLFVLCTHFFAGFLSLFFDALMHTQCFCWHDLMSKNVRQAVVLKYEKRKKFIKKLQ